MKCTSIAEMPKNFTTILPSVHFLCVGACLGMLVLGSDIINVVEVRTPSGWIRGYEENHTVGQMYRFIKIPYAQPPVGNLRFHRPKPIEDWNGVKGTRSINSPQCPQFEVPNPGFDRLENNEDCLYLNIYVPGKISKDRNLSVMVWIHGGGFVFRGASEFKPQKLVLGGDVIVVTINYRLGILGFLTLHDPLVPGNYGLWDQIEALKWIQKNIAAFGGNPNSVTIFGQSSGGMSGHLLTLIPSNKGLFQRLICQSGVVSSFSIARRREEDKTNKVLLEKLDCTGLDGAAAILKCLRDVPVENFTDVFSYMDFFSSVNVSVDLGSMLPTVDGELIKADLIYPKSWDDDVYGFFRSVDFMSGTLDGEGDLTNLLITPELQEKLQFNITESLPLKVLCKVMVPAYVDRIAGNFPHLTQEICNFYTTSEGIDEQSNKVCELIGDSWFIGPSNTMLSIHATNNDKANTYQYLITKPSPFPFTPGGRPVWYKGAGHTEELHLLFEVKSDHVSDESLKKHDLASVDKLSRDVVAYWTNFAKYG
jgi:carboxylesterase type B